jgi:hypothetical protein
MNNVDTFTLFTEFQKRLADHLYDPEPQADPMLDDLFCQTSDNEFAMKKIEREMRLLIRRYKMLVKERTREMKESG